MRPKTLARTLVSLTAIVGIAAGSLATSGAAGATTVPAPTPATVSETVAPLQNFGLTAAEAMRVQLWLRAYWGYTGAIDGVLGPQSWRAFQRCLARYYGYTGPIDGIPGSGTIMALQRLLRHHGYTGPIDGIAGEGTRAAFKRFANSI